MKKGVVTQFNCNSWRLIIYHAEINSNIQKQNFFNNPLYVLVHQNIPKCDNYRTYCGSNFEFHLNYVDGFYRSRTKNDTETTEVYLRWEAEMKASTFGAAMVAHNSRVPTPSPATSLAVIFSISSFCNLCLCSAVLR